MKKSFLFLLLLLAFLSNSSLPAQTVEELQKKLQAAQREIEGLKGKIASMQTQVDQAREKKELPPIRPFEQTLNVEHPILTAYELSSYAQNDRETVKKLLRGKVVSVTGTVERFNMTFSRDFKIFLDTEGAPLLVGTGFNAYSSVKRVFTREDGSELVIDDDRGVNVFSAIHDKVIISGFYSGATRRQVLLSDCVMQKQ